MATTRVPMTFGLMEKTTRKKKVYPRPKEDFIHNKDFRDVVAKALRSHNKGSYIVSWDESYQMVDDNPYFFIDLYLKTKLADKTAKKTKAKKLRRYS